MANTYKITRVLPNGWNIKLLFIPYDATLQDTAIELPEVCLLELGEQLAEFDALPFGLCKPQTLKFKLAWTQLPSSVQDYIEANYSGDKRNTWVLYSDRGTAGATYYCEFAGCEDNVEAVELQPLADGGYSYNLELVDIVYHCLKVTTGSNVFKNKAAQYQAGMTLFQALLVNMTGRNQRHESVNGFGITSVKGVFDIIRTYVSTSLKDNYVRTSASATSLFDNTTVLDKIFTTACELYNCNTDVTPRLAGNTALTTTELFLCTYVNFPSLSTAPMGGLYSRPDNYGWGRSDVTIYDVIRDLCEAFGVKVSYYLEEETSPTKRIIVKFVVRRIASSRDYANDVDTPDVTLSISDSLERPSVTKRGENISKMEVRYETSNTEDAVEIVRIQQGARASRSINIEPIVHNVPVFMKDYHKIGGRSETLKQTNLICFRKDNGTAVKVHEDTKYWYGPKSTQWVKVSTTASREPVLVKADLSNEPLYKASLAAMQAQSSMTAGLCLLGLHAFGNEGNALVEMSFDYRTSDKLLTGYLASRHELTDDAVDLFNLPWAYALPTSISVDWYSSVTKIKYYLFSPTASKEIAS